MDSTFGVPDDQDDPYAGMTKEEREREEMAREAMRKADEKKKKEQEKKKYVYHSFFLFSL